MFCLSLLAKGLGSNLSLRASVRREACLKFGPDKAEDKKWALKHLMSLETLRGITPTQGPECRGCKERSPFSVLILSESSRCPQTPFPLV